jgi:two-component system chemotaxis response regulator CheB
VCEDSRTFAAGLKRFLEYDDDLRVVGTVSSAEQALEALPRLDPDLLTMDVELPGIDGIEATRRILAERRLPIVIVSSHTRRGSERAAAALAAGAIDVVAKAYIRLDAPDRDAAVALRRRIKRLALTRLPPRAPHRRRRPHLPADRRQRPAVVGIGASTGGPQALLTVLSELPADYPIPVLVVQHMTPGFTEGLVRWLDQQVPLPAALAQDGVPLGRGIWFAPDDVHLVLDPSMRLGLDRVTDAGVHRPSVDVLLNAVARSAGTGAVGVVLTGMGRDGADGIGAVRAAGGVTIAQDESTSAVWGMPRAAAERGAELVLPSWDIGPALRDLARRKATS